MDKPKDLSGRYAAMLQREGFDLKRCVEAVDHKVTCAHCGRRRYGAKLHPGKKSKSCISKTTGPGMAWGLLSP